jgi:hypothetical protein
MPVYLTSEGLLTTLAQGRKPQAEIGHRVVLSRLEWEAIAMLGRGKSWSPSGIVCRASSQSSDSQTEGSHSNGSGA